MAIICKFQRCDSYTNGVHGSGRLQPVLFTLDVKMCHSDFLRVTVLVLLRSHHEIEE